MSTAAQTKILASCIGAIVAVSPLVLFCLVAMSGLFSESPMDDAPQRGAAIFLLAGVPIAFACFLGATSLAAGLFQQKILRSLPLLILASLLTPPGIVGITIYFYAYNPRSVFEKDGAALFVCTALISICLFAGLLSSRWYLRKKEPIQAAETTRGD